jgi:hypothetical protein
MAKGVKTGGRVAGTPNKWTAELRDLILGALSDVGGQDYLAKQALKNPSAFMTLVGKILPLQVNASIKRDIRELSDSELVSIASGERAVGETGGEGERSSIH